MPFSPLHWKTAIFTRIKLRFFSFVAGNDGAGIYLGGCKQRLGLCTVQVNTYQASESQTFPSLGVKSNVEQHVNNCSSTRNRNLKEFSLHKISNFLFLSLFWSVKEVCSVLFNQKRILPFFQNCREGMLRMGMGDLLSEHAGHPQLPFLFMSVSDSLQSCLIIQMESLHNSC